MARLPTYSKRQVLKAIESKTDCVKADGKELNRKIYGGPGFKFLFRVSIPKGSGDLQRGTARSIRNQLRLDKDQFRDFVECPMSAKQYAKHLTRLFPD